MALSLILIGCLVSCVYALTSDEVEMVLATHNRIRMAVDPPARNMSLMVCVNVNIT